jgi:hypothetical protein
LLEKFRKALLGYRVVDVLIGHLKELPGKQRTHKPDRATLEARLRESLPEHGADVLEIVDQPQQDVFSNILPVDHLRFFALIQAPATLSVSWRMLLLLDSMCLPVHDWKPLARHRSNWSLSTGSGGRAGYL